MTSAITAAWLRDLLEPSQMPLPRTVTFRDYSITSLSGNAQLAVPYDGGRLFLQIENTGNASIGVNYAGPSSGGTGPGGVGNDATIGSTGTITIVTNGSVTFDAAIPSNPIVVKGTAGQSVSIVVG